MRTLESRMPELVNELVSLANEVSMYERYSCDYIDNLSDVSYTVLKKSFRLKRKLNNDLTLSRYVNKLIKGKLKKANKIV